jgi:lysozyme
MSGVDVSQFQGSISWSSVAAAGLSFAYARVSDGQTLDTTFAQNYSGIHTAGLARGAYQFFEPAQDATAQANLLLAQIGTLGAGDLLPALDVEITGGQAPAALAADILTWVTTVQNATGRAPVILTPAAFWNTSVGSSNFGSYPLWVEDVSGSCPNVPQGWNNWTFWLHSLTGSVSGISGTVDLDELNGSWQIPPLAAAFHFQYRRPAGFSGFQIAGNTATSLGPSFSAMQVGDIALLNPTLQADVDASQAAAVGLLVRMQGNGDAYVGVLTSAKTVEILVFHGATDTVQTLGTPIDVGVTSGTLKFTVTGGATPTLTLFLNNVQEAQVTGNTAITTFGGVGIFAQGANGIVGNFSGS